MPTKIFKQSRRPQAIQSENISKLDFKATIPQRLLYTAKPSTSRYLKIKSNNNTIIIINCKNKFSSKKVSHKN
jgi:hypothetical protein